MVLDNANPSEYHSLMSRLRRIRESLELSQQALASLAGTSQPQIRRLEAGERKLTVEWAKRLAPHLGVTAKELLFDESEASSGDDLTAGLISAASALDDETLEAVILLIERLSEAAELRRRLSELDPPPAAAEAE